MGLLLILIDSYSCWQEVIQVLNKWNSTVKLSLSIIFSRNVISEILVTGDAQDFCDE